MRKLIMGVLAVWLMAAPCWADALTEAGLRVQMLQERKARLELLSASTQLQYRQTIADLAAAAKEYNEIKAEVDKASATSAEGDR